MKPQHALLLILGLSFTSLEAHGQQAEDPTIAQADVEEARRRFQRGVELYREGSFDSALAEFNKAYQLAPNYRVLYNMAQVQTERHDYIAGVKLLEQYLKQGGGDIAPDRREQVEQELRALKGRVSELQITTNVGGAELLVDGASVGELPAKAPILVNSGVRRLQVRKTGYTSSARNVTVAGGESVRLDFELKPEPVSAASSGGQLTPYDFNAAQVDNTPANVPMWISLVATGLFAGGAVTFGVLARSSDEELDRKLDEYPANKNGIDDTRSELKRNALLTDAFAGAAIVGAGFTVYFAFNAPEKPAAEKDSARARPAPRLGIGTMGTGLRLTGQF
ncbi:MAG TPA: PEGA domain-containing protein [Polyangiaceae bacterium]|nr:PEGA domain-containing protein [Polyangiaceae bacterium]